MPELEPLVDGSSAVLEPVFDDSATVELDPVFDKPDLSSPEPVVDVLVLEPDSDDTVPPAEASLVA